MTYYLAAATPEATAEEPVSSDAAHTGATETAATDAHTTQEATHATGTEHEDKSILGLNAGAFVIQLVTFIFVFALLKKFAFNRIIKMLDERHKTIDDGVRMGMRMEQEKAKLDEDVAKTMRDARHEADEIIAAAHKDAREVIRDAEKSGQRKADTIIADAEARIEEETKHARGKLEKELVGFVSEATETIVGEKVDAKRDADVVAKALKNRKK